MHTRYTTALQICDNNYNILCPKSCLYLDDFSAYLHMCPSNRSEPIGTGSLCHPSGGTCFPTIVSVETADPFDHTFDRSLCHFSSCCRSSEIPHSFNKELREAVFVKLHPSLPPFTSASPKMSRCYARAWRRVGPWGSWTRKRRRRDTDPLWSDRAGRGSNLKELRREP